MESYLNEFAEWAWARHHNILSWYIRPLFLIPFCYFSYRRSWVGIVLTLIGLLTSMFWFPVPQSSTPAEIAMLAAEKEYLLGPWGWEKYLMAGLIPFSFFLLALSFWRRSIFAGAATIFFILGFKIVWAFAYAPKDGALAHLAPALTGLIIVKAVVLFKWKKEIISRIKKT